MSSEKLIIYLKENADSQQGILSSDGVFEKTLLSLAELAARDYAEIIVIAPSSAVLLAETLLPKIPKQRLLQALPFALEENLLADIQDLHFAIAPLKKTDKSTTEIPVHAAIVAKVKIRKWLADLAEQGIYPTSLVPAPLCVAYDEHDWSVAIEDGNEALLRDGDLHGSTCDIVNLNDYLSFKIHEAKTLPRCIYLYNFSGTSLSLNLDVPVIEKPSNQNTLLDFFVKSIPSTSINLLQGEFQAKRKRGETKKIWKIIPTLAATWLGLILVSNSISYLALHHKDALLEAQISQIYQQNFPKATAVVAPKQRMTDKLNSLAGGGQKNHFLAWLTVLGHALAGNTSFQIKQLDYRNSVLNLQFTADNFATVDNILKSLAKQNITAKQENVAEEGKTVKGMLVISGGNAS